MALKRLALITENPRKVEEWSRHLKPQGVTCDGIPPEGPLAQQVQALQAAYPLICREQSRLVKPDSTDEVHFEHLALVDHLCRIKTWYEADGVWRERVFEARRAGYLDTTRGLEAGGWWDACFRDARTGLSYQEQALERGYKLSARGAALDMLMDFFAPRRRHAQHLGLAFEPQVVDLGRSVRRDVFANSCFAELEDGFLAGLVESALRQGLFTSVGRTRSQQVYFWPGLSGLPSVPRESEVDEAKFLFHDLVHFLIGRLVPCGEMSEHERKVFVSWAMVEEAIALMLADGYFVDFLKSRGVAYDFNQHKGYPFFCALGLAGRPAEPEEVRRVLWANVRFFVLGDRSGFLELGLNPEDPRAIAYLDGFERFGMGDWLWNERMSLHARSDAAFYQRWWALAKPLNQRAGLKIMSARDAGSLVAGGSAEEVVRGVFDVIMDRRLLAEPGSASAATEEIGKTRTVTRDAPMAGHANVPGGDLLPETEKAKWRWLVGQLGFFAAFAPASAALKRAGALLSQAESFEAVPDFLKQSMGVAVDAGLCTAHQAGWWGDFFPLFPPYYISYKARPGLTLASLAQRILSDQGGAKMLENELGVVTAVICDEARDRFLLERKVSHPNPLCDGRYCLVGGFRQRPDETTEVAWRREATEEWTDPDSLRVAMSLADLARPWRRFRFPGLELPGDWEMDVLLIELESSEFERAAETLEAANLAANRPEGWPVAVGRDELKTLPLLSGHDTALEAFLEGSAARSCNPQPCTSSS